MPSSVITASSEEHGWRSSCCSSLLPLGEAVSEDAVTTMPESADEVEAVDEADEEEQWSRDTAAADASDELWPERNNMRGEITSRDFSGISPLF